MGLRQTETVEALLARAAERFRGAEGKLAEGLLRHYYATVAPEDLAGRQLDDLYGAALCHWQLARRRLPGEFAIRVYTPRVGEDGWQSPHSVVDIVTEDMPFLVDSVTMALAAEQLDIHLLAHPVLECVRDAEGVLTAIAGYGTGEGPAVPESLIHAEIDRLPDAQAARDLEVRLRSVIADVEAAVGGWEEMRARAEALVAELAEPHPIVPAAERDEARALLEYLLDDHYTFLGYREYSLDGEVLSSVDGSGLGIMADSPPSTRILSDLPPEGAARAASPVLLNLTKANSTSTVHRADRFDYVGVKRIAADGTVLGERRFVGLFTSNVYTSSLADVPVVRRKVEAILARCGDPASAHDRVALLSILENYPRDELFDGDVDALSRIVEGILRLRERRRVKLFVRQDIFGRYASCLVFVPRDRYTTEIRHRIQALLLEAFDARGCAFDSQVSGAVLARMHVTVFTDPSAVAAVDVGALEARITDITTSWADHLRSALVDHHGEAQGLHLYQLYGEAFPTAYRDDHRPAVAVDDISRLEDTIGRSLSVNLYRPLEADEHTVRVKLFRVGDAIALTDVLPLLHDLGVKVIDERPYEIRAQRGLTGWIYDFGIQLPLGAEAIGPSGRGFEEAFLAAWEGLAESDGFNGLVLTAGLMWREVAVLRAYRRYLRQIGSTFSQAYYEETLRAHPRVARLIAEAFAIRFDPDRAGDRTAALERCAARLEAELDLVPSLDEDRMLRSFWTLVGATVRTNHYQTDDAGRTRDQLALKLDPAAIPDLPLPRPAHEIFVYSPTVEGVHLRAGRVARGGIRWSDRREDFRTEILGLMKAQMVKNAVIVPVGAKGGFVAKRLTQFMTPEETRAEVVTAYRSFIGGLLDLTDNLVEGNVVPPPRVVRHDDDDTYLVVAADKGTATFSDIANEVAMSRSFWLGDAFASGGSAGYDHKAMGITARGAWESVKRHFRELGIDVQTEPVTMIGIGDMSGDVFGNGALLSPHLRVVGAFDHRHVFVDPDPDPATSYAERRRLFELPRSSWDDYDHGVISEGGGVLDRRAKSVEITPQMRAALGIDDAVERCTPNELLRHMLTAPVGLLWNGGIGTFVKARAERHADVGDRINDAIRVDAADLRCRVIGEGGNLGLTQLARVEFALLGGAVYSDAVDNVGGVNCSDHEVNIKILLDGVVADGDLTVKQRNELLAQMTDEVTALVLAENYRQTTAISASRAQAPGMVEVHQRHLAWLERRAGLDRSLEGLPSDETLNERREANAGLTAPELAVLLAYTKIALADDLLASDLPEDPECRRLLVGYFPRALQERYADRMDAHPLARELIATVGTNLLVDRAGLSMVHRLAEETSAPSADIARAHMAAWQMFDLGATWQAIDALDNQVPAQVQLLMQLETKRLGERATRWLLRNQPLPLQITVAVERYTPHIQELRRALVGLLRGSDHRAWTRTLDLVSEEGVPPELADTVAGLGLIITALDITEVQERAGTSIEQTAGAYFALDDELALGWMRERIIALPRDDRWASLARSALRDDFFRAHAELTESVVSSGPVGADADTLVREWLVARRLHVDHCLSVLADIRATGRSDLAQLSVGLRELRNLIHVAGRGAGGRPAT